MEVKTQTVSPVVGMPEVPHAEITVAWDEAQAIVAINNSVAFGNQARVATGKLLLEAKQNLPYGSFQAWCEKNIIGATFRSMQRWMDLALAATNDVLSQAAASIVQVEQKKLEDLKARPGITGENITRKIEAQEAKIEKLITKMSPPPVEVKPAIPQTEQENRPPRPSMAHTWDPFSRDWYTPEPPKPEPKPQQQAKVETPYLDKRENAQFELARAFTIVLHTDTPEARKIMKQFFSSAFHPDNGKIKKDGQKMSDINHALTTLERK